MRKFMVLFIVLAVLVVFSNSAFAGGSGNCVQPIKTTTKYVGAGAAFEYNYMHSRLNRLDNSAGARDMEIKNVNQIYGKGIVGICDYVNLYGKIGGTNYKLNFVDQGEDATMEIDLKDGLYTGAGINALFPIGDMEPVSFGIGCDLQANFSLNDVKGITRSGQGGINPSGRFYSMDGEESLYVTCKYNIETIQTSLVPYLGAYHSWMLAGTQKALYYTTAKTGYVDKEHFQAAYDFLSFGILFGIDVDIAKFVNLNIEGRLIGETALTTGATIKF